MSITSMVAEKWSPPAAVKDSFEGQVVLVTGANTGLGLQAAKKLAALGPDKLIITTRSQAKGEATKSQIKQWLDTTKSTQRTEITPMVLDMSSSAGVKTFAEQLNTGTKKLDAAILNAGISQPNYRTSAEGFEETIQVNTVSTVFLATLLLPLLTSTAISTNTQPRLTIISSRTSLMGSAFPTSASVLDSTTPLKAMSQQENFPAGAVGGQAQYARSKLMLEYAMRRMVQLPITRSAQNTPLVIINSVCPGVTKTDLARGYEGWFFAVLKRIFFVLFSKSAEAGANSYLQAVIQGEGSMGQMWAGGHIVEEWSFLKSEKGRKLGDNVWEEMKVLMRGWDSSIAAILEQKL